MPESQHSQGPNAGPRLSFDTANIQATVVRLVRQVVGNVASTAFEPCGIAGCMVRSLGWSCADCGAPVCNSHGFATLSLKPEVLCVACVPRAPSAAGVEDAIRSGVKKKRRNK